jgi:hypothetical protein
LPLPLIPLVHLPRRHVNNCRNATHRRLPCRSHRPCRPPPSAGLSASTVGSGPSADSACFLAGLPHRCLRRLASPARLPPKPNQAVARWPIEGGFHCPVGSGSLSSMSFCAPFFNLMTNSWLLVAAIPLIDAACARVESPRPPQTSNRSTPGLMLEKPTRRGKPSSRRYRCVSS